MIGVGGRVVHPPPDETFISGLAAIGFFQEESCQV